MSTIKVSIGFCIFILVSFMFSCQKNNTEIKPAIVKDKISGYVQKGPFINGTSLNVFELNNDLSQTGKAFNTQIVDNKGSFELHNIELVSDYVSLRADGYYFNEITGDQSASQLTLYALSDISNKSNINVNVLTHLEKGRVEYLVSNGSTFKDAKIQAIGEILKIFNIQNDSIINSEKLDISLNGEENNILLSISCILQGYRTESEFTELMSNISNDIREDGILNDSLLGSELINHALYLDTAIIFKNTKNYYNNLGVAILNTDFGKSISNFISSNEYEITNSIIKFPEMGGYGPNLLSLYDTLYSGSHFSFYAKVPKGAKIKVKLTFHKKDSDYFNFGYSFNMSSLFNWKVNDYNASENSRVFESIAGNSICDVDLEGARGDFQLDYYVMGSLDPTYSKKISINR